MNAKVVPVIALVALLSLTVPAYAQPTTNQSLGIMINSMLNGVSAALQHAPKGTPAYTYLSLSLSNLKTASKLYNEGNYTGAEQYLKMSMNESYHGVVLAGGQPFTVPPGLNQSREVALRYASDLMSMANGISNQTLKEQVISNITTAISLLQTTNASQIVPNMAQARQILGSTNAQINQYAKHDFARRFQKNFLPLLQSRARELNESEALAFNYSVSIGAMQIGNESVRQILHEMMDYNQILKSGKFVIPMGTIGDYHGLVYITLREPLQIIVIGNETFVSSQGMMMAPHGHGRHMPFRIAVGIINSTYAYNYVLSNAGSQIVVFPPSNGNSQVQVVLEDLGTLNSAPSSSYYITYRQLQLPVSVQFNISNF